MRRLIPILAICVVLPACGKADKRINLANFEKIQPNMTKAEVDELLGGPGKETTSDNSIAEGSSVGGAVGIGGDLSSMGSKSPIHWYQYGTDWTYIKVAFLRDRVAQNNFKEASKKLK